MINHFYLIYFNIIKWMESNKVLNNDRKYAVAEFYLYIIICEWLIFIVIGLTELSILSENFIIENKWTTIGIVTLMVFLVF